MLNKKEAVLCAHQDMRSKKPFKWTLSLVPEWVVVGHRCQAVNRWGQCNEAVYPDVSRGNVPRLCRSCRMYYADRGWGKSPRIESNITL